MIAADLIVEKASIASADWRPREAAPLQDGEARLRIDAVALTANNVTYAAFANFAGYWDFFPAGEETLGRVPHWGFATVEESRAGELDAGTRVYGYLPVSSDLVVRPGRFDRTGFSDMSPHRAHLPHFYNRLHLTATDTAYVAGTEDVQMLVRPLYATGWLLDDYILERDNPPHQVIVSSASSKTALAMAHRMQGRDGLVLTGLTSAANVPFVERTGFYTHVVSYDALGKIPKTGPARLADFLGDPSLRTRLENELGDVFAGTVGIGATAWNADRTPLPKLGDTRSGMEMFFAPSHADACAKRLGPAAFGQAMNRDMTAFYPVAAGLVNVRHISGREAIAQAWRDMVAGKVPPTDGLILRIG